MKAKSDADVARGLGISPQALSAFKKKGKFPSDLIIAYCMKHQLSLDDIFQGEDQLSMVAEDRAIYNDKDFAYIPQVTGEISAGGGLIPDDRVDIKLAFRRDWIQHKGEPQNMSLIRVSGDSMEPTLLSGDLVLIDHNRNFIDPQGGIYAISMDNIIMIKRVQLIYHENRLRIISDNSRYETIDIDPAQVKINGKIIWYGRELER